MITEIVRIFHYIIIKQINLRPLILMEMNSWLKMKFDKDCFRCRVWNILYVEATISKIFHLKQFKVKYKESDGSDSFGNFKKKQDLRRFNSADVNKGTGYFYLMVFGFSVIHNLNLI